MTQAAVATTIATAATMAMCVVMAATDARGVDAVADALAWPALAVVWLMVLTVASSASAVAPEDASPASVTSDGIGPCAEAVADAVQAACDGAHQYITARAAGSDNELDLEAVVMTCLWWTD